MSIHPPIPRRAAGARGRLGATLLAVAILLVSCNDSTSPEGPDAARFQGSIDPASPSFVLQRVVVQGPDGGRHAVELVGRNLQVDAGLEQVSIDVALRNASGTTPLQAPAQVWVGCFAPGSVRLRNFELGRRGAGCLSHGFRYDETLGDDGILLPGETSLAKRWTFAVPGLVSFSFTAAVDFAAADTGVITGHVFEDGNRNGIREDFEPPYPGAAVAVRTPDGTSLRVVPDDEGLFSVPAELPGLYSLRFVEAYLSSCQPPPCWCVTTRDPLDIVLLPGPGGRPRSYHGADIGVVGQPCWVPIQPVLLVDRVLEVEPQDPYALLAAHLAGDVLTLRVGLSGCSPAHPLTLYAGRSFGESIPVTTALVLAHDDRDEPCDAWFERSLYFDLDPIRQEHLRVYGVPAVVRLRFHDAQGQVHTFLFGP